VFRKLAAQKESRIEEKHLLADHMHMMISIPPEICRVQTRPHASELDLWAW
jgi:REP element-mobilizing transposase RayT